MSKYIVRDDKKIIFLNNNEILFEYRKTKRKRLSTDDYDKLKSFCQKFILFSESDCSKNLFKLLIKNKLIMKANDNIIMSYKTPLERTELFATYFFKNKSFYSLKNKKILFIGTGGIASTIIDQLIAVGITNYSLVDFDTVDISNLNRQFIYCEDDIGKYKVEIFKKYILNKNKKSNVKIYNFMLKEEAQLSKIINDDKIDFIINSADMPPYYLQKNILNNSIKYNIPCIFGGVGINEGSYGPLLSNNYNKQKYLKYINKILNEINFIFPCKSSFGVTNSLISNYMSWDIIMYLLNEKKYVKSLNRTINIEFKKR